MIREMDSLTCPRCGGKIRRRWPTEPPGCAICGYENYDEWTLHSMPPGREVQVLRAAFEVAPDGLVPTGDILAVLDKVNIPQPVTRGFGALMRRAFPGASHCLLPRGWQGIKKRTEYQPICSRPEGQCWRCTAPVAAVGRSSCALKPPKESERPVSDSRRRLRGEKP